MVADSWMQHLHRKVARQMKVKQLPLPVPSKRRTRVWHKKWHRLPQGATATWKEFLDQQTSQRNGNDGDARWIVEGCFRGGWNFYEIFQ